MRVTHTGQVKDEMREQKRVIGTEKRDTVKQIRYTREQEAIRQSEKGHGKQ